MVPNWPAVIRDYELMECREETIFVVCVECGAREAFETPWSYFTGRTVNDAEATKRFEALGWHVEKGNVRCPKHVPAPPPGDGGQTGATDEG